MIAIIKSKTKHKWIAFPIVICLILSLQINTFQYQDLQKLNSHQSKLQVISHASDPHIFQQKGKQNEAAELLSRIKIDQKSLVLQLNAKNFNKTLDSYDHVIIYFYTEQCSYCQEFDKTYEDMNKKYHENPNNLNQQVIFAKILLTEQTQEIFKELNIQSVPDLKYFYKSKPTNYSYNFNQYGNSSINNHLKWIKRSKKLSQFQSKVKQTNQFFVFNKLSLIRKNFYIPEIQNLESVGSHISQPTKVLILNCSLQEKQSQNIELSSFLKQIFIKHLEKEFFCTYNSTILIPKQIKSTNLAQVNIQVYQIDGKSKGIEHSETINLDNKVEYGIQGTKKHPHQKDDQTIHSSHLQQVYHQNFKRYSNKEIRQWTQQSAIQIFTEHQPGFLLIINNQTKSHKVLEWYKQIKHELNLNISLPGVKFYFSDLSITPQTTTRIKKYLSGIATALKKTYPYPILGFMIQKYHYIKKFLFPIQREMTKQDLKQWIVSVIDQIILMKQPSTQQFKHTAEHQTPESHQKLQQDHAIQQTSEQEQQQQNKESQGLTVTQFFRSTPQSLFPVSYTNLFNKIYFDSAVSEQEKEQKLKMQDQLLERHHEMRFINFYDFRILLSRFYPKDFFVYINWKNQFHAYEIYNQLSEWWQVEEQQKQEPKDTQNQKEIAQNPQTAQNNNQSPHDQNTNLAETNQPHQQHQNAQNDDAKVIRQLDQIQTNQAQNSQLPNYPEQQQIKSAIKDNQQHAKASQLEKQKHSYDEVTSKSNIFILNFNNNDYPATYTDSLNKTHQLKINNVPSILYFSHDRQFMDILDGIQSFDQVKNFIFKQIDHLKKSAYQSQSQPLLQSGKKSQVKDLSESNRDLLSVNNYQKKI